MSQLGLNLVLPLAQLAWMDGSPTEPGIYWRQHHRAITPEAVHIVKLDLGPGGWRLWRLGYGEGDAWDIHAGDLGEYRWARVPGPPVELVF
jgi:hypothetical protein